MEAGSDAGFFSVRMINQLSNISVAGCHYEPFEEGQLALNLFQRSNPVGIANIQAK